MQASLSILHHSINNSMNHFEIRNKHYIILRVFLILQRSSINLKTQCKIRCNYILDAKVDGTSVVSFTVASKRMYIILSGKRSSRVI